MIKKPMLWVLIRKCLSDQNQMLQNAVSDQAHPEAVKSTCKVL